MMIFLGLRLGLRLKRSYLFDFVLELVYLPIEFIVFYYVYSVLYSGSQSLGGYGFDQLIVYIFASFMLRRIYPISVRGVVERDIYDGYLVRYLVRPFGYLNFLFGRFLASFIVLLPFFLLVIVIFQIYFVGGFIDAYVIVLFVLSSLLGFIVTFELYAITGLASYWLGRHHWLGNLLTLSTLVLGGGYIPLSFFSEFVQKILVYLPLQAVYNFPASIIALGYVDHGYFVSGIVWSILLLFFMIFLEKKGLSRFEAVGG